MKISSIIKTDEGQSINCGGSGLNIKPILQETKGPKTMQTSTPINGLQQSLMKTNSVDKGSQHTGNVSVNQSGPLQNSHF